MARLRRHPRFPTRSAGLIRRAFTALPTRRPSSLFLILRKVAYSVFIMSRVNILGEALDGLGRWYVAVPPFLIIGFLAALFFLTGAGQERLQEASGRLQNTALRELAIDELQTALARSVAAQRGYLLTGDQKYLRTYENIVADVEPRLEHLRKEYQGSMPALADVRNLHVLIGKRLADLSMLVAIQRAQGVAAAIALVKTSVGADAGEAIADVMEQMRSREGCRTSRSREALVANRWS